MADKNKDESVRNANLHDLRDHFEFAHAIAVAMGNNCPTVEWRSWEDVLGNVKKPVMDEVLVSTNLAEAYAEFKYDIGNLVRRDCSTKFESWKKVPKKLKKSMLRELSVSLIYFLCFIF
ncbi:serine hydroxymethyltransferase 7-like [Pyrus ussuriensis x Pyrus communis]|uniref:Serine hydroxymethyltransferase 7-like n=1 Tax=Pyrus ussuriensis x Pyrus communis TaxID=2448454 RepID=A0A5N5H114_9ROSA|nr:serine hydroxymethyltransferase 7-like [Pyrus ussuriensis x Pyrus communis]